MKGGSKVVFPPGKTTFKKPSLIRVKTKNILFLSPLKMMGEVIKSSSKKILVHEKISSIVVLWVKISDLIFFWKTLKTLGPSTLRTQYTLPNY